VQSNNQQSMMAATEATMQQATLKAAAMASVQAACVF